MNLKQFFLPAGTCTITTQLSAGQVKQCIAANIKPEDTVVMFYVSASKGGFAGTLDNATFTIKRLGMRGNPPVATGHIQEVQGQTKIAVKVEAAPMMRGFILVWYGTIVLCSLYYLQILFPILGVLFARYMFLLSVRAEYNATKNFLVAILKTEQEKLGNGITGHE